MQYFEAKPSPPLTGLIKCFWSITSDIGSGAAEPVLPDGCPEIVFNLSDRFRRIHRDGSHETQPTTLVSGQLRSSISILSTGRVELFGVRFQPSGAFTFLQMPLSELTDHVVPLEVVIGREAGDIGDRLAAAANFDERVRLFESSCLRRLKTSSEADKLASRLTQRIAGHRGQISVSALCAFSGLSERTLERTFHRYIGISPKTFARIVRFQHVVRRIETAESTDMLDTALEFGYYDQSHMIREFREFAGTSPMAYFDETHRMSEFFTSSDEMSDSYNTAEVAQP